MQQAMQYTGYAGTVLGLATKAWSLLTGGGAAAGAGVVAAETGTTTGTIAVDLGASGGASLAGEASAAAGTAAVEAGTIVASESIGLTTSEALVAAAAEYGAVEIGTVAAAETTGVVAAEAGAATAGVTAAEAGAAVGTEVAVGGTVGAATAIVGVFTLIFMAFYIESVLSEAARVRRQVRRANDAWEFTARSLEAIGTGPTISDQLKGLAATDTGNIRYGDAFSEFARLAHDYQYVGVMHPEWDPIFSAVHDTLTEMGYPGQQVISIRDVNSVYEASYDDRAQAWYKGIQLLDKLFEYIFGDRYRARREAVTRPFMPLAARVMAYTWGRDPQFLVQIFPPDLQSGFGLTLMLGWAPYANDPWTYTGDPAAALNAPPGMYIDRARSFVAQANDFPQYQPTLLRDMDGFEYVGFIMEDGSIQTHDLLIRRLGAPSMDIWDAQLGRYVTVYRDDPRYFIPD